MGEKMNLTEDEMKELKKDLLYFVKRLSQKGYNSPEEVEFLPAVVQILLGRGDIISNFNSGS